MASGGVSRSGRVRKKSAKLIEMENESNSTNQLNNNNKPLVKSSTIHSNNSNSNNSINCNDSNDIIVNNNNNNSNESTGVITSDLEFSQPLKKKFKIKLSLSPSPVITTEVSKPLTISEESVKIESNASDCMNSSTKKATIPPLKIPKSKITGILSPNAPHLDTIEKNETQMTPKLNVIEEKPTVPQLSSVERKTKSNSNKKVKTNTNKKETIALIPDVNVEKIVEKNVEKNVEKQVIESTPEVNNLTEKVEETEEKAICEQSLPTTNSNTNNSITETPKVTKILKPKKKEHESAANRLFRQITSGVPTPVSNIKTKGNKKKKFFPLEDLSTVSIDDDFEETSLVIATEDLIKVKPKNKRSRQPKALTDNKREEKKSKKAKNLAEGEKPKKKRSVITAYMLWSKEHRSKIQQTCPDMDFADVSRKLGEIWQSMPKNEKTQWKRKAQKLTGKGSSLISTGKPKLSSLSQDSKVKTSFGASSALSSELLNSGDDYSRYTSIDEPRPIGTSPIDVSAHLRLLGESLSLIGQRLKEHSGQIAVSGSLSVLLDSTLCAIGPLLCLTELDPKLDGCSQETHKKTLDNIAYIMPGI